LEGKRITEGKRIVKGKLLKGKEGLIEVCTESSNIGPREESQRKNFNIGFRS
jgi:hypothetical protein